jgi:predicted secreted protein
MAITSSFVLFAVIWFMLFLMILPMRLKTQGESGEVVPGTHASSPENPQIKKKAKITTLITLVLWAIISYLIIFDIVTARDIDWMGMMN